MRRRTPLDSYGVVCIGHCRPSERCETRPVLPVERDLGGVSGWDNELRSVSVRSINEEADTVVQSESFFLEVF